MRDEDTQPNEPASPDEVRDAARQRILTLRERRRRLEDELRATMEGLPQALRQAHEAGLSWAEIAELASYRNATVARNQAAPRSQAPPASDRGSFTVREAAEILGVTPQAVYSMIESGRIRVADKRPRGTRVYLPSIDNSPGPAQQR